MSKSNKIEVKGTSITILKEITGDFISLTDMLKAKDGDFFISDWLRNRNTVEFLGIWESVNNPNFNYGKFAIIRSQAGLNSYKISVKEWVEKTNAIGLKATAGRYGGTLAKINYRIHTDAIRENIIPDSLTKEQINQLYANEADVLNTALFCKTAKQWRDENPKLEGNIRDYATIEQLLVLANIESLNAEFIKMGLAQGERLSKLNHTAITQMKSLAKNAQIKKLNR